MGGSFLDGPDFTAPPAVWGLSRITVLTPQRSLQVGILLSSYSPDQQRPLQVSPALFSSIPQWLVVGPVQALMNLMKQQPGGTVVSDSRLHPVMYKSRLIHTPLGSFFHFCRLRSDFEAWNVLCSAAIHLQTRGVPLPALSSSWT